MVTFGNTSTYGLCVNTMTYPSTNSSHTKSSLQFCDDSIATSTHHHILTHSDKSDVGDSTKSSIASSKKVARFPPKNQGKIDKHSDSEPKKEAEMMLPKRESCI